MAMRINKTLPLQELQRIKRLHTLNHGDQPGSVPSMRYQLAFSTLVPIAEWFSLLTEIGEFLIGQALSG